MREFLNAILAFIGSASLTDLEFSGVSLTEQAYSLETYEALKAVLQGREDVSGQLKRLAAYFTARGVDLSSVLVREPVSEILLGGPL